MADLQSFAEKLSKKLDKFELEFGDLRKGTDSNLSKGSEPTGEVTDNTRQGLEATAIIR